MRIILIAVAVMLTACNSGGHTEDAPASPVHIADAQPQPFCMGESIGLVALNPANVSMSGNAHIGGDVVMLDDGDTRLTGNGSVDGTLYVDSKGKVTFSGNATYGALSTKDLSYQADVVSAAISSLGGLTATQSFASIQDSTTITGNGGLNVIDVSGDIQLSGKSQLILSGTDTDTFIVNVGGAVSVTGQASIDVGGTALVKNVIINNTGLGSAVQLSGQSHVGGTIFAADRGFSITGGAGLLGSVIAGGNIQISGNGQVIQPQAFCSPATIITFPVPQPTPSPTPDASPTPSPTPSASPSASPTPSPSPSSTLPPQCLTDPVLCA